MSEETTGARPAKRTRTTGRATGGTTTRHRDPAAQTAPQPQPPVVLPGSDTPDYDTIKAAHGDPFTADPDDAKARADLAAKLADARALVDRPEDPS